MPFQDKNKKRKRTVKEIFGQRQKRCERCGKKISGGRYCYQCGKFKGLW